jgi:hypothetical protein
MNTFFDESGGLNIDDLILQQPSFQKIMEDGIVTEEEIAEQKNRVIAILKKLEKNFTSEQIDQVRELLAEISVLVAVQNKYI